MSRSSQAERGFTLLEALVAFAGLAITLAVALPLLAGGLRGVDVAARRQHDLAVAESRLADAIGEAVPPFGSREGSEPGGSRWRLTVEPIAGSAGATRLARYEVQVAGPDGQFESGIRLVTLHLVERGVR